MLTKKGKEFIFETRAVLIVCFLLAMFLAFAHWAWSATDTCFSPYENCEDKWAEVLESAKHDITLSCFGITNKRLGNILLEKSRQGVKVLVLEDKMQSGGRKDIHEELIAGGAEVVIKKATALEHNKMVVVDSRLCIIGSWNLSGNAQKQDNSMIITDDKAVVASALDAMDRIYRRDRT